MTKYSATIVFNCISDEEAKKLFALMLESFCNQPEEVVTSEGQCLLKHVGGMAEDVL